MRLGLWGVVRGATHMRGDLCAGLCKPIVAQVGGPAGTVEGGGGFMGISIYIFI
jgi:hypothetical protein